MPAQTATDFANMIAGSEFVTTVTTASSDQYKGIYSRGPAGTFDVNDSVSKLLMVRADADNIAIGSTITIDSTAWTVREKQPNDDSVTLLLEAQ